MADIKITDLVEQSTIDQLKTLNAEMQNVLATYITVAKDLATGINVPVKGIEDLEKLQTSLAQSSREAAAANDQLTKAANEQSQAIANTTNTISRQLMEKERLNKLVREEYKDGEKVREMIADTVNSYDRQAQTLAKLDLQIKSNKKSQSDLEKAFKSGKMSEQQYLEQQAKLLATGRDLSVQKSQLTQLMTAEEKLNNTNAGSYNNLSQQLEILKKTYKNMSDTQKETEIGKEFERSIQDLDAHLKDLAADMGEFQRNVGNYAIAGQNGVVSTESVIAAMRQEAVTQQDLVDQTKILEEAKMKLDQSDANYAATLNEINAKLEENRARLTDVTDIMGKEASSVAEAESQNKRLSEAIKHIDLNSDGAKKKLEEMRAQIERNNRTIDEATGASEKLADNMLGLIGLNADFGQSFAGLAQGGNIIDGLNTKAKALWATMTGLLANPAVLTLLGIAGAGVVFKWWYDYNKGLIEASRLTENFTGKTGEAADKVTADMQTLAEHMGKGYDATISAANTLVQQFGMSWDEAGHKMQEAIEAGADMNGNLLANIERFAPALRDAGVSADEFMSILAETRNGIFNEQGISNIVKAGTRLKAMTPQIESALDAVGISAKQMQKDLEEGNISMLDAVQQVAGKLKELPENSQEAGLIMKNVFGRTAAEGGALLLQSIADVNTNLEKAKENMGDLGRVNAEQMNAQRELNEALISIFKASGTSFEIMTTKAKTFVIEGLVVILNKCADAVNWFIELYNKSKELRIGLAGIGSVFKAAWTMAKAFFDITLNGFKELGTLFEGIMLIISGNVKKGTEKITSGFTEGLGNMRKILSESGKEIGEDFANSINKAATGTFNPVSLTLEGDSTGDVAPRDPNGGKAAPKKQMSDKEFKEQLKILEQLEEAKIGLMSEGHEKEIALIRLNFKKKIDAITGNSKDEQTLRMQLVAQMEYEIAECERQYQQSLASTNMENRLAIVKKGSREELDLKLALLEMQRQSEVEEAGKTGADVNLIEEKYLAEADRMREEYANIAAHALQQKKSEEQEIRDAAFVSEMAALEMEYAEKLKAAKGNADEMEKVLEGYNRKKAERERQYAAESAQSAVDALEQILKTENLSEKERLAIERELVKAKAALEKQMAENAIDSINEVVNADEKAKEKRMNIAQQIMQAVADSLNGVNELVSTIYDAKIEKIEADQEAQDAASEADQERITELVEKKVITEEEGEARKRAAEAESERRHEELEKKKQQLKTKQAKWDKANSIAQATIATSLAVASALKTQPVWLGIAMAALVGAMGAVEIATILATPIPAYAKGTDSHKGGPALVGDGGREEVIVVDGKAWLTPDYPTLVNIPKGASVLPDAGKVISVTALPSLTLKSGGSSAPVIINDYNDLRREMSSVAGLIRQQTKAQMRIATRQEYELFKSKI